ncbi:hypothetical protein HK098_004357 [Nowakowskiella sp. JEL0407]|nr:hypothetical protein HK098_004357 [Nowakowskiella sp. JEL0407]
MQKWAADRVGLMKPRVIPSTDSVDPDEILNSPPRSQLFLDEIIHFYLLLKPPSSLNVNHKISQIVKFIDVQITASLAECVLHNGTIQPSKKSSIQDLSKRPQSVFPGSAVSTPPLPANTSPHRIRAVTMYGAPNSPAKNQLPGSPVFGQRSASLKDVPVGQEEIKKSVTTVNGKEVHVRYEEITFAYTYHDDNVRNKPLISNEGFLLLPLRVLLDVSKRKGTTVLWDHAILSVDVTMKPNLIAVDNEFCDPENFDSVNLFDGLIDDPFFNPDSLPIHRIPFTYKQNSFHHHFPPIHIQKVIPLSTLLDIRISTACLPCARLKMDPISLEEGSLTVLNSSKIVQSYSDSSFLLSVSFRVSEKTPSDTVMEIQSCSIDLPNSVVKTANEAFQKISPFPAVLQHYDELDFVFDVTLLDDTPSQTHSAAVAVQPPPLPPSRTGSVANIALMNRSAPPPQQGSLVASKSQSISSLVETSASPSNSNLDLTQVGEENPIATQILCLTVESVLKTKGLRGQKIVSKWYCVIDKKKIFAAKKGVGMNRTNLLPTHGKKPRAGSSVPPPLPLKNNVEMNLNDQIEGLSISFSVENPVYLRKLFSIQTFLVNNSNHVRYLTLRVPNQFGKLNDPPSRPTSQSTTTPIPLYELANVSMNFEEYETRWTESERQEASLVCLENNIRLGPLLPGACQSVNLHFIPIKGHIHVIELIQVVDHDLRRIIDLSNVLMVHVNE